MRKHASVAALAAILIGLIAPASAAFDAPSRQIDFKMYTHVMFPNDLMESNDGDSPVENEMGIGFGVKARTQIAGPWGFVINTSITDLNVSDNSQSIATTLTTGFYWTRSTGLGNITLDLSYGVIAVADMSTAMFAPSVEINRPVSERVLIALALMALSAT